jgi:hypothetical protein
MHIKHTNLEESLSNVLKLQIIKKIDIHFRYSLN